MDQTSLLDLAEELLSRARTATSGRAATPVFGGAEHSLRQTVIALVAGQELAEHNNPGEATLQVLRGRVRVSSASGTAEGSAQELIPIPPERHGLAALEDSVVLLTTLVR